MSDANKNKHLNNLLNDLYKEVNQAEEDAKVLFKTLNAGIKERAVAKAVATRLREQYKKVYQRADLIGTLNKSTIENAEATLEKAALNLAEITTAIKVSELSKELDSQRSPLGEAIDGDFKLANQIGYTLPSTVRTALETLAKIGILRKAVDIDLLLAFPTNFSFPRGNPAKGAMVRKLLSRGYTKDQANIMADKHLEAGITSTLGISDQIIREVINHPPELTPEQQVALAQVNKDRNEKSNADLLAMLGTDDGTPQIDTTVNKSDSDIDTSFDSNFSEEKEAS